MVPFGILLSFLLLFAFAIKYYLKRVKQLNDPVDINFAVKDPVLYTDSVNYIHGDKIKCYINSSSPFEINVYLLEEKKTLIQSIKNGEAIKQTTLYNPKTGCNWKDPFEIDTEKFSPGFYSIGIKGVNQEVERYFHAIIISPKVKKNNIAVFASTNTWAAYNCYGGSSNYEDYNTNVLYKVPYKLMGKNVPLFMPINRPNIQNLQDIENGNFSYNSAYDSFKFALHPRREWPLIAFLTREEFKFDMYSDWDIAYNPGVLEYEYWIFNNHTEYWSWEMKGMLKKYIEKGGKVIFASGNNMYRDVEFYNHGIKMGSQISDMEITTKLTGTFFTEDGYLTMSNYKIIDNNHFLFEGIVSSEFGEKSLYNYNGQAGASGIETDKINYFSDGFDIIAVGNNKTGPSHMVFKRTEKGWVFNASSISFASSLLIDNNCAKLFLNLLNDK